jgi:hypothetical protein
MVTHDTWHMTCATLHVTPDMRDMVTFEHSLKISDPYLLQFGIDIVLEILNKRITYQIK